MLRYDELIRLCLSRASSEVSPPSRRDSRRSSAARLRSARVVLFFSWNMQAYVNVPRLRGQNVHAFLITMMYCTSGTR